MIQRLDNGIKIDMCVQSVTHLLKHYGLLKLNCVVTDYYRKYFHIIYPACRNCLSLFKNVIFYFFKKKLYYLLSL